MSTAYEMVREFTIANGQLVNNEFVNVVPNGTKLLRIRLIVEEIAELCCAIHEQNVLLTADALADALYVVVGCGVAYGIRVGDQWREPDQVTDIGYFLTIDSIAWARRLQEHALYVTRAIENENGGQVASGLRVLIFNLNRLAEQLGIPLRECFAEVHRSNMSKRMGAGADGKKYIEGGGKGPGYTPPDIAGAISRYKLDRSRRIERRYEAAAE